MSKKKGSVAALSLGMSAPLTTPVGLAVSPGMGLVSSSLSGLLLAGVPLSSGGISDNTASSTVFVMLLFNKDTRLKQNTNFPCHLSLVLTQSALDPLSPDIKIHVLLTVIHTFLMELVRRICLNDKISYPW